MAEIVLKRADGHRVDRRRAYRVFIDNQKAGKIQPGESKAFEVAPGRHQLQLKIDWGSSEKRQVDVTEGSQATFVCRPRIAQSGISLKVGFQGIYFTTIGRRRYIVLDRAD